jgi:hypothetical protein
MTFFGAVKIKPAILFAIPVIKRNAIRISVIAHHRKDSSGLFL